MDYREELRKKLDLFPIGFPKTEEITEILRLLFSDEAARVTAAIPMPPLFHNARRIARKAGMGTRETSRVLKELIGKALIIELKIAGEKRYTLFPAMPGFIEMQFMLNQEMNETRREVARLWHNALDGEYGDDVYGFPTSGFRVVPVAKTVDASQKIYSFEEVEKLIKRSGGMALGKCACRSAVRKCDAPVDVCLIFNPMADYLAGKGLARRVSRREAMAALELAEDAGLVHTTVNTGPPVLVVCNCCKCCCAALHGVTRLGRPAEGVRSNFLAERVEDADCKLCGICAKHCPVGAITMGEKIILIESEKCIGCGVCVHKCGQGAIALHRVGDKRPPLTILHLLAKMYEERGKTEMVLREMAKDVI